MQYLLTAEEMAEIRADREKLYKLGNDIEHNLKHVCMNIVTQMSYEGGEPHGCIHSKEVNAWYCDGCPVDAICLLSKDYSK